ncbi:MAG: adenylate/guanylate cyclase domain-containing protein [Candidatus Kapaibacterium sp.]
MIDSTIKTKLEQAEKLLFDARHYAEAAENDMSEECAREAVTLLEQYAEKDDLGLETDPTSQKYNVIRLLAHAYNRLNLLSSESDYAVSIQQASIALGYAERIGDTNRINSLLGNISLIYTELGSYELALENFKRILASFETLGLPMEIAQTLGNIGFVYFLQKNYTLALEYSFQSLAIFNELHDNDGIILQLGNIGDEYRALGEYPQAMEYYGKALALTEEVGNRVSTAVCLQSIGELYATPEYNGHDSQKAEEYLFKALAVNSEFKNKRRLYENYRALAELYDRQERWKEYAVYSKKYHALKEEAHNDDAKKQAESFAYERRIAERERHLAIERTRAQATHEILANILPASITERLLGGEKKIADTHHDVSVLFIDIVGFTELSTALPPHELIDVLDIIFSRFDAICKKHGLEKIKTIGDAYMAVCGAPLRRENHAERAALAALEMLEDFSLERSFSAAVDLDFRIGLHTGSVVAGIIGENKYSYDLWGDAVNTASRMESHGEAGKIHVSEEFTRALVETGRDPSLPIQCIPRGEMEIKGKGLMKTYFLERINF